MTTEADAAATIQTLQENAKRLGLTWDLTMGSVSAGLDPTNVSVVFDADADTATSTSGLISIIGQLAPGERVYILTIPPSGNYVIGRAAPIPQQELGHVTSLGAAGYTTEIVLLTMPKLTYPAGGAFEIQIKMAVTDTVAAFLLVLIRRGTTTGGAVIAEWEWPTVAGGAATDASTEQRFINNTATDITENLVLTSLVSAGVGTAVHVSPFGPFWFSVKYLGPASKYPGLNSI